jgi:hypothetical protein
MPKSISALLGALLLLTGCSGVDPAVYRGAQPKLDLFRSFDGTVDAWGYFADRSGEVVKRFKVEIRGRIENDALVLEEDFRYADGSSSRRVWTITRAADGRYRGRAADVVGEAQGVVSGNALRWTYVLALEVDGSTWNLDVEDWMYLQDERVMLNKSVMRKFGFRVGEVILAFRRRG